MAQTSRRSRVLLDRRFQLQFSTRLGVILLGSMAFFFVLSVMAPAAFGLLGGSVDWGTLQLSLSADVLIYAVALPLLGCFLTLMGQGIRESFRIAGPAGRLIATFQQIGRLVIPQGVRIRKDDYLQEVADELSNALERVQDQVRRLQDTADAARQALDQDSGLERDETRRIAAAAIRDLDLGLGEFRLVGAAPECAPLEADRESEQSAAPPSEPASPATTPEEAHPTPRES